jgi:hypothetical protein
MRARRIAAGACKARLLDFPRRRIDLFYIFACGILWRKEANQDAARELLHGLSSPNAMICCVAKSMLDERTIVRAALNLAEDRRRLQAVLKELEINCASKSEQRSMIAFRGGVFGAVSP